MEKSFDQFPAVRSISFSVAKGNIVGLLGPNGAGKTTTMRMMTGFYSPTSGDVQIKGMSIQEHKKDIQKLIGYLPESSSTYSDMLVADYLDFIADSRGLSPDDKKKGIEKAVEATGLHKYYYRPISKLSKGYKQRVGLASTLTHDPEILILDEPTSGLDPNQIREIQKLIKELSLNKTIILSTHILSEVEAVCERAIIINEGSIVLDKSLKEITEMKRGLMSYHVRATGNGSTITEKYREIFDGDGKNVEILSSSSSEVYLEIKTTTEEAGAKIFDVAVRHQFVLTELKPEKSTLEDVFASITSGESSSKENGGA